MPPEAPKCTSKHTNTAKVLGGMPPDPPTGCGVCGPVPCQLRIPGYATASQYSSRPPSAHSFMQTVRSLHTLATYRRELFATLSAYRCRPSAHSYRTWLLTIRKILESAILIASARLLQSSSAYSLFFVQNLSFRSYTSP